MATAVACALALTACGGDGGDNDSTSTRADEGIWGYFNSNDYFSSDNGGQLEMQAVILSDGSYWGVYGGNMDGFFSATGILHGAASINGGDASGTYMNVSFGIFTTLGASSGNIFSGTYTGTASAQHSLNLTFNEAPQEDPVNISGLSGNSFSMSYDNIYNQPASLSSIAGNYQQASTGTPSVPPIIFPNGGIQSPPPGYPITYNLSISGSSLSLVESDNGNVVMTGTIAPHGTVNVFDVNLTTTANTATAGPFDSNLPSGTVYKGILFQTSGALKNNIEIVAAAGNSALFYMGTK